MVKKQTLVVLVTLMSFIGSAFGLGLGDITVKSNLNDPLEAEIQLIQLQGLSSTEILPTLASNDDFKRAGIERTFFLANIQFLVQEDQNGNLVLALSTKQAVREPFLNFLVEVNWPGGRLLKEYTILLDPPVFDTGLAVDALVVEPTATTITETDLVTTTVVDPQPVQQTTVVSEPVAPREDNLPAGQYRVQRNDTLWEIAMRVPAGNDYSPQQVMLAIQDLNPNAFLNNNINRVKAGSVLTLPDESQIAVRSLQEAVSEVQAQNSGAAPKLRNQQGEVQLSATDSTASALPVGEGEKNPDGYLELSADAESETSSASGDVTAEVDSLQNQLAAAEELNDQYLREREELQARVSELQEQIAIMERLIDVQNSDLAEVQQAFGQESDAEAAGEPNTVEAAESAVEDAVAVAEDAGVIETEEAVAGDEADTALAESSEAEITEAAEMAGTVNDEVEDVVETQPVAAPEPQPEAAPVADKPGGVMGFVQKFSDWVTASITNMAIVGGGFLLLILLALYARGKKSAADEEIENTAEELVSEEFSLEHDDDFEEDLLAEADEDFEEESEEPEALDAVVEAEMYMAYQKYDQAEEKLKEAFAEYPDRVDIGLKLLEVYAETGDANAFNDLESRLAFSVDEQQQVSDLRKKLPAGSLDDLGSGLESDMMAGDLNLDLDSDDTGSDVSLDAAIPDELDFSSELSVDDNDAEDSSDIDFTLDLDAFGTDEKSESENLLDLDLETSAEAAPEELDEDFDFSLDFDALADSSDEQAGTEVDLTDIEGLDLSEERSLDEAMSGTGLSLDENETNALSDDLDFALGAEGSAENSEADLTGNATPEAEGLADEEVPVVSEVEDTSMDDDITFDFDEDLSLSLDDEIEQAEAAEVLEAVEPAVETETEAKETSLVEEGLALAKEDISSSLKSAESETSELVADDSDFASLDLTDEALDLDVDFTEELSADPLAVTEDEPEIDLELTTDELGAAESDEDPLQQLADSLDSGAELDDDDFDFLSGSDEASTKLDLARAYIEMDDKEGARDILEEVLDEGSEEQKAQATALIEQL